MAVCGVGGLIPVCALGGAHDFDFAIGTWKTHIRRLSGSSWIELNGTVVTRPVWGGKAQLEEISADGPSGHFEGMNLFLFNPSSGQWSLNWSSSADGTLGVPSVGSFKDGVGEFYDQETIDGRSVLVRGVWSDITATTHRFVQANSYDGGKTWAPNFIAEKTLISHVPSIATEPVGIVSHDFDFDFGTWNMHMRRLRHPLTDSASWFEMSGITTTSAVWGGKANLAEVSGDGPYGHLEILALRLYNPLSHQWSISFASSGAGVLSVPCVGEFRDGVGEFIDQETYGDRTILVRFKIGSRGGGAAWSEQAFSNDGGKTWETNWINEYKKD
jgi:hypothetical protein